MQYNPGLAAQIAKAAKDRSLVKITRRGIEQVVDSYGYVFDAGPEILLLEVFGGWLKLDGYETLRIGDIASFDLEFYGKEFILHALSVQSTEPCAPKGIELGSWREVVTSVSRNYPLVVVHRERLYPGECGIGQVKLVSDDGFALKHIDVQAEWDSELESYHFRDVTKISFGAAYETVLALVAEKRAIAGS